MSSFLFSKCKTEYFNVNNSISYTLIGDYISELFRKEKIENKNVVVLCIGTDRATGDCLGPLVGRSLIASNCNCIVYGSLEKPVHALNLSNVIHNINKEIDNPFIVAVDASLGDKSHIGYITVSNCPISPGKGVNKNLPPVGDISITGIVNIAGKSPALLQSTRLNTVMTLSDYIANAIIYAIDYVS